ncbi:MAG TPA: YjbH domain-containing protein, partial [Paracoccaceae bacterium]|nr:YjbH domain-containing protein [Paracoccaceae bacterium]
SLFDPDQPLYHDLSLAAAASYRLAPGLSVSGQISRTITGNFDRISRGTKGSLPAVRTDIARYLNEQGPRLDHLTLDWFAQHSAHVFSRLSAGYLETMYAGLSAEVYARHPSLPLAAALEVNVVRARDFDQGLGLRDLPGLAQVNGHASVFWETGFQQIEMQLDVGRYLAGDLGATLSVSRDFRNGWEIGAFATLTDASSAEFGEGSFDKGVFVRVPLAFVWPRETGISAEQRISSLTGDGGQRLSIRNRLHEIVSRGDARSVLAGCRPGVPCLSR